MWKVTQRTSIDPITHIPHWMLGNVLLSRSIYGGTLGTRAACDKFHKFVALLHITHTQTRNICNTKMFVCWPCFLFSEFLDFVMRISHTETKRGREKMCNILSIFLSLWATIWMMRARARVVGGALCTNKHTFTQTLHHIVSSIVGSVCLRDYLFVRQGKYTHTYETRNAFLAFIKRKFCAHLVRARDTAQRIQRLTQNVCLSDDTTHTSCTLVVPFKAVGLLSRVYA